MKRIDRLTKHERRFAVNIAIGIAIFLLLTPLESNAAIAYLRDALLTWQSAQLVNTASGDRLAWLDVDDDAYRSWGTPAVTPRDKLCRLIDFAVRGGARAVVVDFDLAEPAPDESARKAVSCDWRSDPKRVLTVGPDAALLAYVRAYGRDCEGARRACAPLIFTRTLHESARYDSVTGRPAREARPTILDSAGASRYVVWGTSNFQRDSDFMLRRWRLWEPVCRNGRPEVLPSTELLAAAGYYGYDFQQLNAGLSRFAGACAGANDPRIVQAQPVQQSAPIRIGPTEISGSDDAQRWFFYRFGLQSLTARIGAAAITDADARHRISDPAIVRGRNAIVGGSYADNPDFHRTPLGELPGALVVLNAVNALISNDRIREEPLWERFCIEFPLIVLVSALFLYLPPRTAMLGSSFVVVVSAITVGYLILDRGYWFDPILPLIGIQIHELIAGVENRIEHKRAVA